MSKYLVTGGAGFIGSNIVKKLVEIGEDVRVIDNFSTGKRQNLISVIDKIELIEGDIRSYHVVLEAVKGIDYVLHEAALPSVPRSVKDPLTTNEVNIVGTLNLLQVARDNGVKRFVFASSSSIYGDTEISPKKENFPPNPKSPYAISKLAGEQYCKVFYNLYGLPTISLRYFNVFGPNQDPNSQYSAVIPKFIKLIKERKSITVYGDGEQTRDFTYVENVVNANLLAIKSSKESFGEIFNVACGDSISLNHVIKILFREIGQEVKINYDKPRMGDVKNSEADIRKSKEILGYKVLVNSEEGLKRSINYY